MLARKLLGAKLAQQGEIYQGAVAFGNNFGGRLHVYEWSDDSGFGAKYANPSPVPGGTVYGIKFTPDGANIVCGFGSSPYARAYEWTSAGFGPAYPDLGTADRAPSAIQAIGITPSGQNIVAGYLTTNPLGIGWPFSAAGFGSKFTPSTVGGTGISDLDVHPSGQAVVFGSVIASGSVSFAAYRFDDATKFGTRYTDVPSIDRTGVSTNAIRFTPDGAAAVIGMNRPANGHVAAFRFDLATGWGTRYADPAVGLSGDAKCCACSPSGNAVVYGHTSNPWISAYQWSTATGFGAKYANPADLLDAAQSAIAVAFSPSGRAVFVAYDKAPYVAAYQWSDATGFGPRYPDPAVPPTGACGSVGVKP